MKEVIVLKGDLLYKKLESLKKVKADGENWHIFYIDDSSGEKWVEEYPNSELHGGGPPILRLIEKFPWE